MTISWLYEQTIAVNNDFPHIFTANTVLVSISNNLPPTWRKMGYLTIEQLVDGEWFEAEIRSVRYGNTSFHIPYPQYRISFEPVNTLTVLYPDIQIKIAETNINMWVNNPPPAEPVIGDAIHQTITPAQANAPTPVFTIDAAKRRHSIYIKNNTNKTFYYKEGAAASAPTLVAANPFTAIAAGGSATIMDYSGDIVGIMSANYANGGTIITKVLPLV